MTCRSGIDSRLSVSVFGLRVNRFGANPHVQQVCVTYAKPTANFVQHTCRFQWISLLTKEHSNSSNSHQWSWHYLLYYFFAAVSLQRDLYGSSFSFARCLWNTILQCNPLVAASLGHTNGSISVLINIIHERSSKSCPTDTRCGTETQQVQPHTTYFNTVWVEYKKVCFVFCFVAKSWDYNFWICYIIEIYSNITSVTIFGLHSCKPHIIHTMTLNEYRMEANSEPPYRFSRV